MNAEKEKWTEEVFQSMKGSQRAKPSPELFAKIEEQIEVSETKIVSMYQLKYAAAAAALILLLNITVLFTYRNYDVVSYEGTIEANTYSQSLISTYQIYE